MRRHGPSIVSQAGARSGVLRGIAAETPQFMPGAAAYDANFSESVLAAQPLRHHDPQGVVETGPSTIWPARSTTDGRGRTSAASRRRPRCARGDARARPGAVRVDGVSVG